MKWSTDLELTGGGLLLRPYLGDDLDAMCEAAVESVEMIYPWLEWCHPGYRKKQAREWVVGTERRWRDSESFDFAIFETAGGRFLGGCSLNQLQKVNRLANLGYWVRASAVGRGVAPIAVRLVAAFGLESLGLARVELVIAVGNQASMRVAEKVGARREGILRNRLWLHGQSRDAVMYSLVPGEVEAGLLETRGLPVDREGGLLG